MEEIYLVFERDDTGTSIIAKIVGEQFSGEQAELIEQLLRSKGFPAKRPDAILHGSRCWATRQVQKEQP